jgi:hypothetical protein
MVIMKSTPIFINNFECLKWPRTMIEWLASAGYDNIHIIDNASTYPPLLEWYAAPPRRVRVHLMQKNLGKRAPWIAGFVKRLTPPHAYYVVTDPDLDLRGVPHNVIEHLSNGLIKFPSATKVGLGLALKDLPRDGMISDKVLAWEKKFWQKPVRGDGRFFHAPVDTTFAVHRLHGVSSISACDRDLRCNYPYVARHLPWYVRSRVDLTEEDHYRYARTKNGYWNKALGQIARGIDRKKITIPLPK